MCDSTHTELAEMRVRLSVISSDRTEKTLQTIIREMSVVGRVKCRLWKSETAEGIVHPKMSFLLFTLIDFLLQNECCLYNVSQHGDCVIEVLYMWSIRLCNTTKVF